MNRRMALSKEIGKSTIQEESKDKLPLEQDNFLIYELRLHPG